jgi:hypothetical protein
VLYVLLLPLIATISTTAAARNLISQSFANISLMQLYLAQDLLEISETTNSLRTSYNFITLNKGLVQNFTIALNELLRSIITPFPLN